MQNRRFKQNVSLMIMSIVLVAVLATGAAIFAIETARPNTGPTIDDTISNKEDHQKGKNVKTPATFVPTEKVSADQAVAFPTDI